MRTGKNRQKTRILILHYAFTLPSEPGSTKVFDFAKYLAEKNYKVQIITGDRNYITDKKRRCGVKSVSENLAVTYCRLAGRHHGGTPERVKEQLSFMSGAMAAGLKSSPEIVIAISPPLHSAIAVRQ